ncbi:MAG: hypothetical protein M1833_006085 [Piccolia ochrophora]|nr:MAG: hypothetical protein M1833_006085 [Piccolia ochrophora]
MLPSVVLTYLALASLGEAFLFLPFVRGVLLSGRFVKLLRTLPDTLIDSLENDENAAGEFVCNILDGRIDQAFFDVAGELSEEVVAEFSAVTEIIGSIPTLAPAVLSAVEEGGEQAVSIIGELVNNPAAAITVIVDGVKSVVENAWDVIWSFSDDGDDGDDDAATTATGSAAQSSASTALMLESACANRVVQTSPQATTTAVETQGPTASSAVVGPTFTTVPLWTVPAPASSYTVVSSAANPPLVYSTPPTPVVGPPGNDTAGSFPPGFPDQSGEGTKEQSRALWVWGGSLACAFGGMILL